MVQKLGLVIFYKPERDGALNLMLELRATNSFGHTGACDWSAMRSAIWLADQGSDREREMYVEAEVRELEGLQTSVARAGHYL